MSKKACKLFVLRGLCEKIAKKAQNEAGRNLLQEEN